MNFMNFGYLSSLTLDPRSRFSLSLTQMLPSHPLPSYPLPSYPLPSCPLPSCPVPVPVSPKLLLCYAWLVPIYSLSQPPRF